MLQDSNQPDSDFIDYFQWWKGATLSGNYQHSQRKGSGK